MADARVAMDRMYRHQRHIYDLTRKFYLLGRDRLIADLEVAPGDRICEIGCGTGRNLIALARRYPHGELHGLDASAAMLETARVSLRAAGLADRVTLHHGLAEEWTPRDFGLDQPFDTVIFAYSLSMIPDWRSAVERAIANLRPGGSLVLVDFWDQHRLPEWFGRLLRRWLDLFGVHPRPEMVEYFHRLRHGDLEVTPIFRGYAVTLRYRKDASTV